eukprot:634179_1
MHILSLVVLTLSYVDIGQSGLLTRIEIKQYELPYSNTTIPFKSRDMTDMHQPKPHDPFTTLLTRSFHSDDTSECDRHDIRVHIIPFYCTDTGHTSRHRESEMIANTVALILTLFISCIVIHERDNKMYPILLFSLRFTTSDALVLASQTTAEHNCAMHHTKIKCWGLNDEGQLGIGNMNNIGDDSGEMGVNLPPPIDLGSSFISAQIVAGSYHTCALSTANRAKCWGWNIYGQLGLGDASDRGDGPDEMGDNLPYVDLGSNFDIMHITAGSSTTCALSTANKTKCWGYNPYGQLGHGDTSNRGDGPNELGVEINLGSNFIPKQIVAGAMHTCALSITNALKCFGKNNYGQLGYGDTNNRGDESGEMGDNLPIIQLGSGFEPIQVALGARHTCAISSDDRVRCWGLNDEGQLGVGHANNIGDEPGEMGDNLLDTDLDFIPIQIEGGYWHTCALSAASTVKCWGYNFYGQLGYEDETNRGDLPGQMGDKLLLIDLGSNFIPAQIITGEEHTCASSTINTVKCFGRNGYGQLGKGHTTQIGDYTNEMGDNLLVIELGSFPTPNPTASPSDNPTKYPTSNPTKAPTNNPSIQPTRYPTSPPTANPSANPSTKSPTDNPTIYPTQYPTKSPTDNPTASPSRSPTDNPTAVPTTNTQGPTNNPTVLIPTTANPSGSPTHAPSNNPVTQTPTSSPTHVPSQAPTFNPTSPPTGNPTSAPVTHNPTAAPSSDPTDNPSGVPTSAPSRDPTINPTRSSSNPSSTPTTGAPTSNPTSNPTTDPTVQPTIVPTSDPTVNPTLENVIKTSDAAISRTKRNEDTSYESDTDFVFASVVIPSAATAVAVLIIYFIGKWYLNRKKKRTEQQMADTVDKTDTHPADDVDDIAVDEMDNLDIQKQNGNGEALTDKLCVKGHGHQQKSSTWNNEWEKRELPDEVVMDDVHVNQPGSVEDIVAANSNAVDNSEVVLDTKYIEMAPHNTQEGPIGEHEDESNDEGENYDNMYAKQQNKTRDK